MNDNASCRMIPTAFPSNSISTKTVGMHLVSSIILILPLAILSLFIYFSSCTTIPHFYMYLFLLLFCTMKQQYVINVTGWNLINLYVDETENNSSASGSGFFLTPIESLPTVIEHSQNLECSNMTCREGFYCIDGANDAVCNPSCASWKQYPDSINAVFDSLLLISVCVGVICGVGVLVLAGLRRSKV